MGTPLLPKCPGKAAVPCPAGLELLGMCQAGLNGIPGIPPEAGSGAVQLPDPLPALPVPRMESPAVHESSASSLALRRIWCPPSCSILPTVTSPSCPHRQEWEPCGSHALEGSRKTGESLGWCGWPMIIPVSCQLLIKPWEIPWGWWESIQKIVPKCEYCSRKCGDWNLVTEWESWGVEGMAEEERGNVRGDGPG